MTAKIQSAPQSKRFKPALQLFTSRDDAQNSSIRSVQRNEPYSPASSTSSTMTAQRRKNGSFSSVRSDESAGSSLESPVSSRSRSSSGGGGDSNPQEDTFDTFKPINVMVCKTPYKDRPSLRRCSSPTTSSLRDICRMQSSEENLRDIYESQTLAYLNDMIRF